MDFNKKRDMALFGAYLSMLAYMDEAAQHKYISRHITDYTITQDRHKSLQFFVLDDNENKRKYIAIRGTDTESLKEGLRDLRVSLNMFPRKVDGFKVHRGYSKSGDAILKKVMPNIVDSEYNIVFVGHSLGGVVAKYCAIRCGRICKVLTYGAPKLAERDFYSSASYVDVTNYVNLDDIIPQFPHIYDDCKLRNHYIMNDEVQYVSEKNKLKALVMPFISLVKNTLWGTVAVGLHSHSIKNYIRHLSRLRRVGKE